MKSNKGIAMLSLVIYVASFLVITMLVGTISTYFYNNMDLVSTRAGGSAEFNKLNIYLLDKVKDPDLNSVYATKRNDPAGALPNDGIVFLYGETGTKKDVFVKYGDLLYLNETVIATNVDRFEPVMEDIEGKRVLSVLVELSGVPFTMRYVIE